MRMRLRPALTPGELAVLCPVPHEHAHWPDHVLRVAETIRLGRDLIRQSGQPGVIADLSCGDAVIARTLAGEAAESGAVRVILGDFAPGYEITGLIEETISLIDHASLFICCETIEHLDDPDQMLKLIRDCADRLLLSTPAGNTDPANAQHYWAWDSAEVGTMLAAAGWHAVLQRDVSCPENNAAYQIWGCR